MIDPPAGRRGAAQHHAGAVGRRQHDRQRTLHGKGADRRETAGIGIEDLSVAVGIVVGPPAAGDQHASVGQRRRTRRRAVAHHVARRGEVRSRGREEFTHGPARNAGILCPASQQEAAVIESRKSRPVVDMLHRRKRKTFIAGHPEFGAVQGDEARAVSAEERGAPVRQGDGVVRHARRVQRGAGSRRNLALAPHAERGGQQAVRFDRKGISRTTREHGFVFVRPALQKAPANGTACTCTCCPI
jgi:hypothetical protein